MENNAANSIEGINSGDSQSNWITIGCFDGVHLGHKHLIQEMCKQADSQGGNKIAFTFSPHPAQFFNPEIEQYLLMHQQEKKSALEDFGLSQVLFLKFDQEFANLSARNFILKIQNKFNISSLWVGHDFSLGASRKGDIHVLESLGHELGFSVFTVPPFKKEGQIISSSAIRKMIQDGDVEKASTFLGRPFSLFDEVIHGDGRGSKIGIPTANLQIASEFIVPSVGVYATYSIIGNQKYPSVTGIGYRPTFSNTNRTKSVETHIMDLDYNLYGKTLKVEFIKKIRNEIKFPSVDALINQINQDIKISQEVLAHAA